jgi:DNA repair exonuclease SbcCD nuclease subunit
MLLVTDFHLDNYRQFATITKEGLNSRLVDQLGVIGAVSKLIEETRTENVIFLGDLFNSLSDSLPKLIYNAAFAAVRSWSKNSELFLIVGNHDIHKGFHLFSAFAELPNVHVISNTLQTEIEGYKVDLVPWGGVIPPVAKGDILMGHIAVRGTKVNSTGMTVDEGCSPLDLKGYKNIFLGHYHERQPIPIPGAIQAEYIGSLMQIDRGSTPEPRGVVALREGVYDFFPIPSPHIYSVEVINQDWADRYVKEIEKGNYWHLTVTSPEVALPSFDHRVQVEYNIEMKHETRLEEKEGEDLLETVKRFIEGANTNVDKERAVELLGEVM